MTKHSCPDCKKGTYIKDAGDFPWAGDLDWPWVVWARHIHTGKVQPSATFKTVPEAERYIEMMKDRCTSHENFVVMKYGETPELKHVEKRMFIREYSENGLVDIVISNGRLVVKTWSGDGFSYTEVDLLDILDWAAVHIPISYQERAKLPR